MKWGPYIEGDLLDKEALEKAFKRFKPIGVLHFAGKAIVSESVALPDLYYRNNTLGTLNLLETCVKFAVTTFVFSSSCATYGIPSQIPIHENAPQNPINPYGKSKLMIEEMLKDFEAAYGIKSVFLRYFNAAGADLEGEIGEDHNPETHLIPLVIESALKKLPYISVFGSNFPTLDGSAIRDYVHVQDLAEAHLLALEFLTKTPQTIAINLGTGFGFSVWDVIKEVELFAQDFLRIRIEKPRKGDPAILIADNKRAKNLLGWEPKLSNLHSIIQSAWNWHIKRDNINVYQTKIPASLPLC